MMMTLEHDSKEIAMRTDVECVGDTRGKCV